MNIKDAIKATYKQWRLMERGYHKYDAYLETHIGVEDIGNDCHLCDFAGEDTSGDYYADCNKCPAKGLWSDGDTILGRCTDTGSQYNSYDYGNDCNPMILLIKQLADENGVVLDEH